MPSMPSSLGKLASVHGAEDCNRESVERENAFAWRHPKRLCRTHGIELHGTQFTGRTPGANSVIAKSGFSGTPIPHQFDDRACRLGPASAGEPTWHSRLEGVVIQISNQSIRVRSSDRITIIQCPPAPQVLFGRPIRTTPVRSIQIPGPKFQPQARAPRAAAEPVRNVVETPTTRLLSVRFAPTPAHFPGCALGKHVEIPGYAGVVVEIVGGSLKVRSAGGQARVSMRSPSKTVREGLKRRADGSPRRNEGRGIGPGLRPFQVEGCLNPTAGGASLASEEASRHLMKLLGNAILSLPPAVPL